MSSGHSLANKESKSNMATELTNKANVPLSMALWLAEDDYDYDEDEFTDRQVAENEYILGTELPLSS